MSSRFPPILRGSPIGMFSTIHLPNENFGEVDPFFIGEHYHQLGNRRNLYDPDGIPHQIHFNQSISNPLICFGWPRIRNYYRWSGNIKLQFYYYAQDSFLMIVCERVSSVRPSSFPPFHSLSTNVGNYRSFEMTMTFANISSSKLLLSEDFANYLSLSDYSKLKLSGPSNNIVTCKLEINKQSGTTVHLGKGWRTFCTKNNIREGHCLEFTADGEMHTNVLIVEKI